VERKKEERVLEFEYNYDRLGIQKLGLVYQLLVPDSHLSDKEFLTENATGDNEHGEIGSDLCPSLIGASEG
jgi:hypothetical protein